MHPRGEFYNEVGDRLADLAFIVPVAFVPDADAVLGPAGRAGSRVRELRGSRVAGRRRRAALSRDPLEARPDGARQRVRGGCVRCTAPPLGARSGHCCFLGPS